MEENKKVDLTLLNQYGMTFDISERKQLIGEMLQEIRLIKGLTQSEVSKYIGIKPGTYSTYENGTREAPAEVIVRLSMLYDISTDILLQAGRISRGDFDVQKQFDALSEEMDELRNIITDKDNELNPQFVEMLQAMTNAFDQLGKGFNETQKNTKK